MARDKISEYDATDSNNTVVADINIAEGCPPSGINNAIRAVMGALKRFQTGADSDPVTIGGATVLSSTLNVTGASTFAGTTIVSGEFQPTGGSLLKRIKESTTVSATAAANTINYDMITQSVLYYTTDATGDWVLNVRGDSGTTLNAIMSTGQSATVVFLATQGSTAYYQTALQVDGSSVTPKWQGGTAPTAGNVSSVDAYVFTLIKTADATFTALGSQTKFA